MPSTRGKHLGPVGDSLLGLLAHLGYQKRASALWGMMVWNEAVGEAVARHAKPERVDGSILWVVVDSAAWAEELRWMEETLLARIEAACGRKAVTGLRMRVGRLPPDDDTGGMRSGPAGGSQVAYDPTSLEPLRQEARAMLPDVDLELGEAFAGLVTQGLRRLGVQAAPASGSAWAKRPGQSG